MSFLYLEGSKRNFIIRFFVAVVVIPVFVSAMAMGCVLAPQGPSLEEEPEPGRLVLVEEDHWPDFTDDLDAESFITAIDRSLLYYDRLPGDRTFHYGDIEYTLQEMKESLFLLRDIFEDNPFPGEIREKMKGKFDLYRAIGRNGDGDVLFTGYFEPVIRGSLERTDRYRYPIYRTPDDHTVIRLDLFNDKYEGERIVARIENGEVIPYYSRKEIDIEGRLEGRGLEIAWTDDPVDLFFMHIQGSGTIVLKNGETIRVSYAASNGRPYRSLGRYLAEIGVVALADVSLKGIKQYLHSADEMMSILAHNESYVFFRVVEEGPLGALNIPVTAGRTIATDPALFPKGAPAFISLKQPNFSAEGNVISWAPFSRFVLNQDTGGAIKGPGRVDLFMGTGEEAGLIAGYMKEYGRLYFLAKKR